MMRLIKAFIASFMPGVIKPLHALWNELLAFVFLTLAAAVDSVRCVEDTKNWMAIQSISSSSCLRFS